MHKSTNMTTIVSSMLLALMVLLKNADGYQIKERCKEKCDETTSDTEISKFQHCTRCDKYVLCYQGKTQIEDCEDGKEWDDIAKVCLTSSRTCRMPLPAPRTIRTCVDSCIGKDNGRYKSCTTCEGFTECEDQNLRNRACPSGMRYDDNQRDCSATTDTCPRPSAVNACVSSCDNQNDGLYRDCTSCRYFVSCKNGVFRRNPCPATYYWDESRKQCGMDYVTECFLNE